MTKRIIVGQGLSGSILTWVLHNSGQSVRIISPNDKNNASNVSAGIISPIYGQKHTLPFLLSDSLKASILFYKSLEEKFNTKLLYPKKHIKIFQEENQKILFESKKEILSPYLLHEISNTREKFIIENLIENNEYFIVDQCYFLDTPILLDNFRNYFKNEGILIEKSWKHPEKIGNDILQGNYFDNNGFFCDQIIFCDGHHVTCNPLFNHLPFRPTKGEIITIELNNPCKELSDYIVSYTHAIIPLDNEGKKFRIGATYEHIFNNADITTKGNETLISEIKKYVPNFPDFKILDHKAGIRPNTRHQLPILGLLPHDNRYGIFNGFGSKGSIWIPYFSELFKNYLVENAPIPQEISIDRFYKPKKKNIRAKKIKKRLNKQS